MMGEQRPVIASFFAGIAAASIYQYLRSKKKQGDKTNGKFERELNSRQ
jgi:hypothetical protein